MTKNSSAKETILITGSGGQDGTLLFDFLKKKKVDIIRVSKDKTFFNNKEVEHCNILSNIDVSILFNKFKISEIYHLAAKVLSTENRKLDEDRGRSFIENFDVNVKSFHNILSNADKDMKIFYPTSSYIFAASNSKLNENSKISPSNLYGINKASAFWLAKYYRENFDLFVSTGIMFNHESRLRSDSYITKKIIQQGKEIAIKKRNFFEVHNANQLVDWGHAKDYVKAMNKILQLPYPDDFIISSGALYSVKDFIKIVCKKLNITYSHSIIKSSTSKKTQFFYGDNTKIIKSTKWKPTSTLEDIVEDMI
jgi:GDPmannose 4,6-dehydratase